MIEKIMDSNKEKIIEFVLNNAVTIFILFLFVIGLFLLYQVYKARRKPRKINIIMGVIIMGLESVVVLLEFMKSSPDVSSVLLEIVIIIFSLFFVISESICYRRMQD